MLSTCNDMFALPLTPAQCYTSQDNTETLNATFKEMDFFFFFFCWTLLDLIQPHFGQLVRVIVFMLLCRSKKGNNVYVQITNSTKETFHTEHTTNNGPACNADNTSPSS